MTLLISAMNSRFCVQVADRRISSARRVVSDEHEKCFSLHLPGFRFSVAFSGLAKVQAFSTQTWLIEKLTALGKTLNEPFPLLMALRAELDVKFATPQIAVLSARDRVLDVSFAGYNHTGATAVGIEALITNSGPTGTFVARFSSTEELEQSNWTRIRMFGSGKARATKHAIRIRKLLKSSVPARAVRDLMESIVRKVADEGGDADGVGKQIDSIILPSDPRIAVEGDSSTAVLQRETRMPASVMIVPEMTMAVTEFTVVPLEADTRFFGIPKVAKNAQCRCGSGKKYKDCHGKNRNRH